MSGIVTFGNRILSFFVKNDGSLSWKEMNIQIQGREILLAAAGPRKKTFFVDAQSPCLIQAYHMDTENVSTVIELPRPGKKMLFFRDRLYVLSNEGSTIFVIDLFAKVVETIVLSCGKIINMCPADHGFVFVDGKDHSVVAYHFNNGFTRFPSLGPRVRVLGSVKRKVFALDTNDELYAITEDGKVEKVLDSSMLNLLRKCGSFFKAHSFVMVGDALIGEDEEESLALRVFSWKSRNTIEDGEVTVHPPVLLPGMREKKVSLCISAFPDEEEGEEENVCPLCFCELEEDGSGITLDCGHSFHRECVEMWVKNWDAFKEKGEHIAFTNALCPSGCKHLLRHSLLPQSEAIASCYCAVREGKAMLLATEYVEKTEDELLYYMCSSCQKPFFGGEKICYRMLGGEPLKSPQDLICPNCEPFTCKKHGKKNVLFKCRYCCNPATQRSFGSWYLCDRCFQSWEKVDIELQPCVEKECPWKGKHSAAASSPPTAMGCAMCLVETGELDLSKIVPAPPRLNDGEAKDAEKGAV